MTFAMTRTYGNTFKCSRHSPKKNEDCLRGESLCLPGPDHGRPQLRLDHPSDPTIAIYSSPSHIFIFQGLEVSLRRQFDGQPLSRLSPWQLVRAASCAPPNEKRQSEVMFIFPVLLSLSLDIAVVAVYFREGNLYGREKGQPWVRLLDVSACNFDLVRTQVRSCEKRTDKHFHECLRACVSINVEHSFEEVLLRGNRPVLSFRHVSPVGDP